MNEATPSHGMEVSWKETEREEEKWSRSNMVILSPKVPSFLSRCHASIVSSSSMSGGGGFFCPYMVKTLWLLLWLLWHYGKIISDLSTLRILHFEMLPFHKLLFPMCAEKRVLEVTDVRAHWRDAGLWCHCVPVWGHPSCLGCVVLLLSLPACFCG